MSELPNTLQHYQSPRLAVVLNDEIRQLPVGSLPLHLGMTRGGYVDEADIRLSVLAVNDDEQAVKIKSRVFFIPRLPSTAGAGTSPWKFPSIAKLISQ